MGFLDIIMIPWLMFGLVVVLFVSVIIMNALADTQLNAFGSISGVRSVLLGFDNLFIIIAIGFAAFTIISSWIVRSHPLMFVVAIFMTLIGVFLSEITRDVYFRLATNPTMAGVMAQFPTIGYFFQHMPVFVLLTAMAIAIFQYIRPAPDLQTQGAV